MPKKDYRPFHNELANKLPLTASQVAHLRSLILGDKKDPEQVVNSLVDSSLKELAKKNYKKAKSYRHMVWFMRNSTAEQAQVLLTWVDKNTLSSM